MHHLRSFSLSLVFSKSLSHSSLQRHARVCNMSLTFAIEVRDSILQEPVDIDQNGFLEIPTKPGLGIELNEENVKKFTVS